MNNTLCGLDCNECGLKEKCAGCVATNGRPFDGECIIAKCCLKKDCGSSGNCFGAQCKLREQLIDEFNALGIEDMDKITNLYALVGSFINSEYTLPGGQVIKFWDDNRIYFGNQICKKNSTRCYGLAADENYLLVCEYGEGGTDAEIVVYKRRKG